MRIVKEGTTGSDAAAMQQLLNKMGANLYVDGDFGRKSVAALKGVQTVYGLEIDGIGGRSTWEKIIEESKVNYLDLPLSIYGYAGLWKDKARDTKHRKHRPYYTVNKDRKDKVFLHHTATKGNPYFVRDIFQRKNGVGTDFALGGWADEEGDYDGLLLQLYPNDTDWAYHINMLANFKPYSSAKKNRDHENRMARRTLAIEVCCLGYLEYSGGKFRPPSAKYITVPEEQVIDYEKIYGKGYRFRGYRYYQRYSPKQINSLEIWLRASLKYIGKEMDKVTYDERWFDYCWEAVYGRRTVMTHTQVRSKSDMHPQPELLDMLSRVRDYPER